MVDKISLTAQKREVFGRQVKKLRKDKLIPANVFGSHINSVALSISFDEFRRAYSQAGESSIVYLAIEGEPKNRPVLIRPPQLHPITRQVLHIDLRQVNLKEKIKTMIDLVLVGEAPAQTQGALIIQLKDQVEVEALPTDLPEQIEVDITKLENIDDTIVASELQIDRTKIEIQLEDEEVIVKAEAPKEEVEEVAADEASAEGETDEAQTEQESGENSEEKPASE